MHKRISRCGKPAYLKKSSLKSEFIISASEEVKKDKSVINTVEFLNKIYNGNEQTKEKTENLNDKVHWELFRFLKILNEFTNNSAQNEKVKRKLSKKVVILHLKDK